MCVCQGTMDLVKFSSGEGSTVTAEKCLVLKYSHEETGTRLLLHGKHAADSSYLSATIKLPGYDLAVLACFVSQLFNDTM